MNAESIFGMIILCLSCFGCGLLFLGLGKHAASKPTPMGFWSGSPEIKPEDVTDVAAYNFENGRMWKQYSIPYFLSGVFGILSGWNQNWSIGSVIFLALACTVGLWWLIRTYQKIWAKYAMKQEETC